MRIHCPHCRAEIELVNTVADSVVTCSACKAVFDPRRKETFPSGERPELLPGIRAGDGFGGYVLEKRLGKGGMGQVFLATQLSLGRKVAVKVLAAELLRDPEFVRRFDSEARVLAQLHHPNIVQVIDKGIERGHSFLVMELVDGVSLRDLLSEKKLPAKDALTIIPHLCDALEYAHARGVVHRDIKPENILIARDGTPKIADFGLARIVGAPDAERITRSNTVMGSLDYMAPEQRERTKDADHRADIYSMGVVLYEMLTGELPLGRWDVPSKKVKLEIDIDEVVLRVLAKDPEMRYQRASDVGTAIRKRMAERVDPAAPTVLAAADLAPKGQRTAGWRAIHALCEDIATRWIGAKAIALAILVAFWPIFLFLAAIEGFVNAAREGARESKLAEARAKADRERKRAAGIVDPIVPAARTGLGLAIAAALAPVLVWIFPPRYLWGYADFETSKMLAKLTWTLLMSLDMAGLVISIVGWAQAVEPDRRGAVHGGIGTLIAGVMLLVLIGMGHLTFFIY